MSSYHGNIAGTGHHIGDGGTVHNDISSHRDEITGLLEQLARQVSAHDAVIPGAVALREDVLSTRDEVLTGRVDTSRIRRLASLVRDGAGGASAVVLLTEQILKLIG